MSPARWQAKNPDIAADLVEATKDFLPKPKDKGALSVYVVRSARQAWRVALLHRVTNEAPGKRLTYIFVPVRCLFELPRRLDVVRSVDFFRQHPTLNRHHFVIHGLNESGPRAALVSAILRNPDHTVFSQTWPEVRNAAKKIIQRALVRHFMRFAEDWDRECSK